MNNKCMTSILLGDVNKEDLPVFNSIKLRANSLENPAATACVLRIKGNATIKITLGNNGGYALSTTDWVNNVFVSEPLVIPADTRTDVYFKNGNYDIFIEGKYGLTIFGLYIGGSLNESSLISGHLEDFAYCTHLSGINSKGKFGLEGNIRDLGLLTELTSIIFGFEDQETSLSGSIEDFVSGQVQAGRTSVPQSAPIATNLMRNPGISFGGTVWKYMGDAGLVWESVSKIAMFNNPVVANSTVVYERGYSAGEIAAWNAAGKTVKDVLTNTDYPATNG